MPRMLPFRLHAEVQTRIIEEQAALMLERVPEKAEEIWPDLMLPGMKKLPARQRVAKYVFLIDRADMPYIEDPDYLDDLKAGLLPPPVSPFLLNLVAVPEAWNMVRKDLLYLKRTWLPD